MEHSKIYESLAKLNLTETEQKWVNDNADRLTESFFDLEKIQTEGVEPLVTVLQLQNVLREDKTHKLISREKLLSNAPEQYDGFFQVPKTLE